MNGCNARGKRVSALLRVSGQPAPLTRHLAPRHVHNSSESVCSPKDATRIFTAALFLGARNGAVPTRCHHGGDKRATDYGGDDWAALRLDDLYQHRLHSQTSCAKDLIYYTHKGQNQAKIVCRVRNQGRGRPPAGRELVMRLWRRGETSGPDS